MKIYITPDAYQVLAFDQVPEIDPCPLILAGEEICPGDRIVGILSGRTSAGFGNFHLASGAITYVGQCAGQLAYDPGRRYALFSYPFPVDENGLVNGHAAVYVGWGIAEDNGEVYLLYSTPANAGRIIQPVQVLRAEDQNVLEAAA